MGQTKPKDKPDDWILLGTLVHAILKAGDRIQNADNVAACGDIADALSDFARDMGQISGVKASESAGVTSVTRGGRTAIVGTADAVAGAEETAANDDAGDAGELAGISFGGKINDPLNLGRQLGDFLSQIMNVSSDLESLGDRIVWLDALMVGIGGALRKEIPIPGIAAIYARTSSQILATHLMAAQMSGRADFGLRRIDISNLTPDINLMDFVTDKTSPEMRAVFQWLEAVPGVVSTLAGEITPEDIEGLGYSSRGPTRH
jgi:hypothetical protein